MNLMTPARKCQKACAIDWKKIKKKKKNKKKSMD